MLPFRLCTLAILSVLIGYNIIHSTNTDADVSIESVDISDISSENLKDSRVLPRKSKSKSRLISTIAIIFAVICWLNYNHIILT